MDMAQLEQDINAAWEDRDLISAATTGAVRDAVNAALACWMTAASAWRNRAAIINGM